MDCRNKCPCSRHPDACRRDVSFIWHKLPLMNRSRRLRISLSSQNILRYSLKNYPVCHRIGKWSSE
ncbi:hypothetical protein HanXRQr2_Chr09g0368861 [Helianthus annuus]|uniref:Uncharacterized protein n=1 Tax=Helianthus annuus TaxID=4232 RepID=A0A9K3I2G5_HELAN|nr:hypothetical protein HanXRQr2_Chr09g0368861 [Helianthus annuus]